MAAVIVLVVLATQELRRKFIPGQSELRMKMQKKQFRINDRILSWYAISEMKSGELT
jgi:hypothetical protein